MGSRLQSRPLSVPLQSLRPTKISSKAATPYVSNHVVQQTGRLSVHYFSAATRKPRGVCVWALWQGLHSAAQWGKRLVYHPPMNRVHMNTTCGKHEPSATSRLRIGVTSSSV